MILLLETKTFTHSTVKKKTRDIKSKNIWSLHQSCLLWFYRILGVVVAVVGAFRHLWNERQRLAKTLFYLCRQNRYEISGKNPRQSGQFLFSLVPFLFYQKKKKQKYRILLPQSYLLTMNTSLLFPATVISAAAVNSSFLCFHFYFLFYLFIFSFLFHHIVSVPRMKFLHSHILNAPHRRLDTKINT